MYMAARNEAKAMEAIEELRAEGFEPGNGEVDWLKLDLSDPREAKKAAEAFMEREKRLDVLGACVRMIQSVQIANTLKYLP